MRQFVDDHRRVLHQLDSLEALRMDVSDSATEQLAQGIRQLSARVELHLAIEEKFLYPLLIESGDRLTSGLAKQSLTRFAHVTQQVDAFCQRYRSADGIAAEPERFDQDRRRLFRALRERITFEEHQLFPLAGRL